MNDPAIQLVEWLEQQGEINPILDDESWVISPERIPTSESFDAEKISTETRNRVDIDLLGSPEGIGITLTESQREKIQESIRRPRETSTQINQHVLAWYQPIHYFGLDWGIFITTEGLLEVAQDIASYVMAPEPDLAEKLVLAAFSVLYYHELFHHRAESAAIRMHVIDGKPCYRKYTKNVYNKCQQTRTSSLEEQLAMADMFRKIDSSTRWKQMGSNVRSATRSYLLALFNIVPPCYQGASSAIRDYQNQEVLGNLLSSIQESTRSPLRSFEEWKFASNISKPLFSITQNIWEITPSNSAPLLPHSFPLSKPRQTIENALKQHGFVEIRSGGKGSHSKWRGPNGEMVIVPLGKEIFGSTVSNIAKTLNIEVRELEKY